MAIVVSVPSGSAGRRGEEFGKTISSAVQQYAQARLMAARLKKEGEEKADRDRRLDRQLELAETLSGQRTEAHEVRMDAAERAQWALEGFSLDRVPESERRTVEEIGQSVGVHREALIDELYLRGVPLDGEEYSGVWLGLDHVAHLRAVGGTDALAQVGPTIERIAGAVVPGMIERLPGIYESLRAEQPGAWAVLDAEAQRLILKLEMSPGDGRSKLGALRAMRVDLRTQAQLEHARPDAARELRNNPAIVAEQAELRKILSAAPAFDKVPIGTDALGDPVYGKPGPSFERTTDRLTGRLDEIENFLEAAATPGGMPPDLAGRRISATQYTMQEVQAMAQRFGLATMVPGSPGGFSPDGSGDVRTTSDRRVIPVAGEAAGEAAGAGDGEPARTVTTTTPDPAPEPVPSTLTREEEDESRALLEVAVDPLATAGPFSASAETWVAAGNNQETVDRAAAAYVAAGGGVAGREQAGLELLRDGIVPTTLLRSSPWRQALKRAGADMSEEEVRAFTVSFGAEFGRGLKAYQNRPGAWPEGVRSGALKIELNELERWATESPEGMAELHASWKKYGGTPTGRKLGKAKDKELAMFIEARLAGLPTPIFASAANSERAMRENEPGRVVTPATLHRLSKPGAYEENLKPKGQRAGGGGPGAMGEILQEERGSFPPSGPAPAPGGQRLTATSPAPAETGPARAPGGQRAMSEMLLKERGQVPEGGPPPGEFVEGYDVGNAVLSGLEPDAEGHWPSRVPSGEEEGLILKSTDHPTFWKTVDGEADAGMEWYYKPSTKRWYTLPKLSREDRGGPLASSSVSHMPRGFQKGMVRRKPEEGRDYQKLEQPGRTEPEMEPESEPFVRPRRRPGYDRRGRRIK